MFADTPEGRSIGPGRLAMAMERLFREGAIDGAWRLRIDWGDAFEVTLRTFKSGDWDTRLIELADARAIVHRPSYSVAIGA